MIESRQLMRKYNSGLSIDKNNLQVIAHKIQSTTHKHPDLKNLPETSTEVSSDNYIDSNVQTLLLKCTTPSFLRKSALTWKKQAITTDRLWTAQDSKNKRTKFIAFKPSEPSDKVKSSNPLKWFTGDEYFTQKVNETLKRLKTAPIQNPVKNEEQQATNNKPRNYNKDSIKTFDAVKRLKAMLEKNKKYVKKCIKEKESQLEVLSTRLQCQKKIKNISSIQRPSTSYKEQPIKFNAISIIVPINNLIKNQRQIGQSRKVSIGVNTDKSKNEVVGVRHLVHLSEFNFLPEF